MKNIIEEVALTGIEGQERTLSPERGQEIALAALTWLAEHTGLPPEKLVIGVGQDPRLSGRMLKISFFEALVPRGVACLDLGLSSHPAMLWMMENPEVRNLIPEACHLGVLITSPEGDAHMNGIRFYLPEGPLESREVFAILGHAMAERGCLLYPDTPFQERCEIRLGKRVYHTTERDLTQAYSHHLIQRYRKAFSPFATGEKPLAGLKVSLDAGNGTGGFLARKVLAPLGADISGSQHLDPDGNFFNHLPDARDKGARLAMSMKVLTTGSHLGLLLNCDVSRFTAFDGKGFEIHDPESEDRVEDWLEGALRSILKEKNNPADGIDS